MSELTKETDLLPLGATTEKVIAEYDTLQKIVDQLSMPDYHDNIGHRLENNVAFTALKRMANTPPQPAWHPIESEGLPEATDTTEWYLLQSKDGRYVTFAWNRHQKHHWEKYVNQYFVAWQKIELYQRAGGSDE